MLARGCASLASVIGLTGALAFLLELPWLAQLDPGQRPIHPWLALTLALGGPTALLVRSPRRVVSLAASLTVLLLGALALASRWTAHDPFAVGFSPSPLGAVVVLLLAAALLATWSGTPRLADQLAVAAWVASLPGVLRHVFGTHDRLPLTEITWMSLPAAIGVFLLSAGIVLGNPSGTLTRLLASPGVGGVVLRRFLAASLLLPPLLGVIRNYAEHAGVLSPQLGLTLLVSAGVVLMSSIATATALHLHRADQARQEGLALLVHSRASLAEAQSIAHLGSFTLDPRTQGMEWSTELFRVLGLEPQEAKASLPTLLGRVHPEDRARLERQLVGAGEASEGECRVLGADGHWRDVHVRLRAAESADGAPSVAGVAQDVTDRRRAERELAEREQNLAITLHSIGDGVISTSADGSVLRMNPVAEQITGWTLTEARGRPLVEVLHLINETTRARVEDPVARVLREGRVIGLANHTAVVRRDGTERPIADSAAPIRDQDDRIDGVVLVFRDIAEERLQAAEQERLRARLVAADKLAALGTLAAGVAHEINNPLTYVCTNLDYVSGQGLDDLLRACDTCGTRQPDAASPLSAPLQEIVTALSECREGAERVRRIVRGMKLSSRADDDTREPVDVREVVESSVPLARQEVAARGQLMLALEEVPRVAANPARLGQVVLNLLLNAAQALPPDGADRSWVKVATRLAPDGRVVIEVSDNGTGMGPPVLARIFEPFFTTKPVGQGTGLGLSISHGIVARLGGELTVESRLGEGSTFRVLLPQAPEGLVAPAPLPPHVPARRGRVLIVDDDPLVGRALGRMLRVDHDVVVLNDSRQALERLLAGDPFDAVICDLLMPELTGMDLHTALLEKRSDIAERVVFLTGAACTSEAQHFLERTSNLKLAKPVEPATLLGALRQVIARPS